MINASFCNLSILTFTLVISCNSYCQSEKEFIHSKDNFILVAHRGASGYAPENTLPALRKAIELGANYLEIDVHQSKDNHVVAIHDFDVDRTTDGSGDVKDLTIDEIKELDAGSWFNPKFAGTKIPTLQEVIDILNENVKLIIEVKGGSEEYPGIEENIVSIVKQNRIESQVIFKSFNLEVLELFKKLAPEIPRLYVFVLHFSELNLTLDKWIDFTDIYDNPADAQYFQAHRWFITESLIEKAHANSIKIIVWNVNTEDEIKSILNLGVDGIETDYPDRVTPYLK
jgi:glycerophosphoryl diester phosphodiesterase